MEVCSICGNDQLKGDLGVVEGSMEEAFIIAIVETSPRNWILCDSCNSVVCHTCASYAKTGYCNKCIEKYNLHEIVKEVYGDFPTV